MDDLIYRDKLLAAYDAAHKGPPGGARKLIVEAPAVDAEKVIHCKDCRFCFELGDFQMPWSGAYDEGFYCVENSIRYYSPHYSARTFYCVNA